MSEKSDIIVAGHIAIDLYPKFDIEKVEDMSRFFLPGKLINVSEMVISPGGPVSNTGLNLRKLGMNVSLMGKTGSDFLGNGLLDLLKKMGADKGLIVSDGEMTSYTVVVAPPGIDRIFLHNPGANNTYCSTDIDYDQVAETKLFHLGYPPLMKNLYADNGKELIEIFKKVKSLGVVTSLDMALPDPDGEAGRVDWDGIFQKLLGHLDLLLPSAEESMFMLNKERFFEIKKIAGGTDALDHYTMEDFEWLGQRYIDYGAKIVVLKAGHRGAYIKTADKKSLSMIKTMMAEQIDNWADRELWGEPYKPPKFGSAAGSGDSFIAGFLAAFVRGCMVEEAVRIANCVGCQNVTEMDTLSGVKTWEETLEMLGVLSHKDAQIKSDKWICDEKIRVWAKQL